MQLGRVLVPCLARSLGTAKNDWPVLFMYALWHPYAAHHIPLDLREILRNYITIRKEI